MMQWKIVYNIKRVNDNKRFGLFYSFIFMFLTYADIMYLEWIVWPSITAIFSSAIEGHCKSTAENDDFLKLLCNKYAAFQSNGHATITLSDILPAFIILFQACVNMHKCGGKYLVPFPGVKEFWKSVKIWQSCLGQFGDILFIGAW